MSSVWKHYHVVRGGGWGGSTQVDYRRGFFLAYRDDFFGLRLARRCT